MILSERELELGQDHGGIMVLPDELEAGTPLADVLPIGDDILEIETLYNRPDLTSIYGIAREVAALLATDLRPMPGVEICLVDDKGRDVEPGRQGEIWSKGPECFIGYTDAAATAAAFTADGWYMTGDVGVLDDDGYLTITDRKKDIIIRGGENVSAQEVEELLVRMPGVAEVAVVAAPDDRLGEVGCAFFRMQRAGTPAPNLAEVKAFLGAAGLATQKAPEQLRHVDDFPRTPSGKVQKFVLRERLRAGAT